MNETIVVEDGQAAVATTAVSGTLSPKSSATDIITVVDTPSGKQAALKVYNLNGGGGGGATSASQVSMTPLSVVNASDVQAGMSIVNDELSKLQDQASILTTIIELTTEIGGKTTVALSDLTAMAIDGRPSYKQAGATVYAGNGVVGIIDSVDSTNAIITTVSAFASIDYVNSVVGNISSALDTINGEVI